MVSIIIHTENGHAESIYHYIIMLIEIPQQQLTPPPSKMSMD